MCITAIGSCCASACAGCCCYGLKDCSKIKYGPMSRVPYVFLMFICCLFAVCMALFGEKILFENDLLNFALKICNSESCVGNGAIYRTSFTLFIFFVIHAIIVKCVLGFHYMFFIIKFFLVVVVLTITFFIPNAVFDGFAQFARVGSFFFLLVQIFVLITWAWNFNEEISAKINEYELSEDERDNPDTDLADLAKDKLSCALKGVLIGGTLILYILCIVAWILFFMWFAPKGSDCGPQKGLIAVTIVLTILITIAIPWINGGSLFTTGVVSFYCTYLLYAALESHPNVECNAFAQSNKNSQISMWIGIIITSIAISYTGFSVSSKLDISSGMDEENPDAFDFSLPGTEDETKKKSKTDDDDDDDEGTEGGKVEVDKAGDHPNQDKDANGDFIPGTEGHRIETKANIIFYVCMALSSLYLAMLFTGWGTGDFGSDESAKVRAKISVWINMGAQWVTIFLYVWTLVKAQVCPGDYEDENADE